MVAEPRGIANQFLEAAVEPARWLDVLQHVAAETRSQHAQIVGVGPDFGVGFNWVNGMDASAHAAADRTELMLPSTNYRVAAGVSTAPHDVVWENSYAALRPRLTSDAYLDLCSDLDIPNGCQSNLVAGADGLIGFSLLRSAREGPTDAATRAMFAAFSAAARVAASLQVALEQDGCKLVAGSFDAMDVACFVLDQRMRVRALSRAAEDLLTTGALRLVEGRVSSPAPQIERRLVAATQAVCHQGVAAASVAVPPQARANEAGLVMLKLHRLPVRLWNMGFAPFAILTAKRRSVASERDLKLLRDDYGLTAAETEIAMLLRQGLSRAQIGDRRGIGAETLRSHLRALFGKLGVRRETEAIHLLHALLT